MRVVPFLRIRTVLAMGRVVRRRRKALLVGLVVLAPFAAACNQAATDVHAHNIANSLPALPVIETTTTVAPTTTTTSPPTTVAPHRVQARTTPTTAHPALSYNYEVQLPVETKVYVVPATTTTTPRAAR